MTTPLSRRTFLAAGVAALAGAHALHAAEAAWPDERTAGAFLCHADFNLDPFAELLDELSHLQDDLAAELEVAAPREPVHLFLFAKRTTYLAYLAQYFPKVPARKALYIKGRGPGMVFAYRSAELPIDVRHESTHALLNASIARMPLWLDEGLAEYFEVPTAERAAKNPYTNGVRWNARVGHVPDLAALERLDDLSDMGRDEYRDAWAWVHYLLHGGETPRAVLRGYLRQLASGADAGALSEHLRASVGDPSGQFLRHFREWKV